MSSDGRAAAAVAPRPDPAAGGAGAPRAGAEPGTEVAAATDTPALRLDGVVRRFQQGDRPLEVLHGVSLELAPGRVAALVGPSGAGKSTLLHIAGLLERPDAGEVRLLGRACGGLSDAERTRLRLRSLGFVYQFHHLLPEFTAVENVALPQMFAGRPRAEAQDRARSLLESLGLGARLTHRPSRLSGGEQQRVAIARAMANEPAVLLADEPTGNLDSATADAVFEALLAVARRTGAAALIATHNPDLAARADATVRLRDGLIQAA